MLGRGLLSRRSAISQIHPNGSIRNSALISRLATNLTSTLLSALWLSRGCVTMVDDSFHHTTL